MNQQFFMQLKGITPAEYQFLEQLTKSMSEGQLKTFTMFYTGKIRWDKKTIKINL